MFAHRLSPLRLSVVGRAAATVALCVALACSGGGSSATGPGGGGGNSGSLAITITAPSGITPSVTVTGPNAYQHTIASTQTLSGIAPGSYTVRANAVGGADPIVGVPYAGAVTGSPATVTANATASATVSYTQRASKGLLWVSNVTGALAGFSSSQLASSGSPTPAFSVNASGPVALAFDASGGAWISPGYTADTLYYYTQAQLLGGGKPAPSARIVPGSVISGITALAFDAAGDLWAAGQYSQNLTEFTPAQLAAGGAQAPAVTINGVFGTLERPFSIVFDAKGNLWASSATDSSIVAYSPTELRAGGNQVPVAGITNTANISEPVALAFDATGNLWVASATGPITEFVASDLTTVGSPQASVVLTMTSNGLPNGLAFDDSGDLWVDDITNNQIVEYTPSQLTATGKPTPATVIKASGGSISYPNPMAFSPHASNLPIH